MTDVLKRHLGQQITRRTRSFILEFDILAGRPCHRSSPLVYAASSIRWTRTLSDVAAVQSHHLEDEFAGRKAFALVREMAEVPENEAGARRQTARTCGRALSKAQAARMVPPWALAAAVTSSIVSAEGVGLGVGRCEPAASREFRHIAIDDGREDSGLRGPGLE